MGNAMGTMADFLVPPLQHQQQILRGAGQQQQQRAVPPVIGQGRPWVPGNQIPPVFRRGGRIYYNVQHRQIAMYYLDQGYTYRQTARMICRLTSCSTVHRWRRAHLNRQAQNQQH